MIRLFFFVVFMISAVMTFIAEPRSFANVLGWYLATGFWLTVFVKTLGVKFTEMQGGLLIPLGLIVLWPLGIVFAIVLLVRMVRGTL